MEVVMEFMAIDRDLCECHQLMKSFEFDRANELLANILKENPNNEEACRSLITVLSIRGLFRSVVQQFYEMVRILEFHGKIDEAIVVARKALGFKPDDEFMRKKLILMLRKKGATAQFLKESLALAALYSENCQDHLASALLDTLSRINPDDNDEIAVFRANLLMRQGNINESVALYRQIAMKCFSMGEREKALNALRRLVMLDSKDFRTLMMLGILYQEMEQYDEAEASFRDALRLDLCSEEALAALGNVCILQGEYRDAVLAYSKLVRQNSSHMKAREKLAWIYTLIDEYGPALKLYEEVRLYYETERNVKEEIRIMKEISTLKERMIYLKPKE